MANLLVLHGPNLNLLGTREPDVYGSTTLSNINDLLQKKADSHNINLSTFQSNAEHELVERIHAAKNQNIDAIIINPAAFTHTSVAIRDALTGVGIAFIECHLSNVHAREPFRQHSYLSDIATGVICGFGANSYLLAFDAALHTIQSKI